MNTNEKTSRQSSWPGIESSLGKIQPALGHLRGATDAGWIDYRSMQLDQRFDGIAEQPQFEEIVARVAAAVERMRKQASQNSNL